MSNNNGGFGFNFGRNDDDDKDRDKNRDQNSPFGFLFGMGGNNGAGDMNNLFGGEFHDVVSQFGDMIFGGKKFSMETAKEMALQAINPMDDKLPNDADTMVRDAAYVSELWLNDATIFEATGGQPTAITARDYVEQLQEQWGRMATNVWEGSKDAKLQNMPEMPEVPGMPQMTAANVQIGGFASMAFTTQFAQAWATFASTTLSVSDYGLPFATPDRTVVLPVNFDRIRTGTKVPRDHGMVYLYSREAAIQRLFAAAPWLEDALATAWKETMSNLYIDGSGIRDAVMNIMDSGDNPMAGAAGAFEVPLEMVFYPVNAEAAARLMHLLTLVDTWVDRVVHNALADKVPGLEEIEGAWGRRAASGGNLPHVIKSIFNVILPEPNTEGVEQLWERIEGAVGTERRDHLWDHPEFLPSIDDVAMSAPFIDSLLDDSSFDPIAEINKLFEQGDTGHNEDEEEN